MEGNTYVMVPEKIGNVRIARFTLRHPDGTLG
jgi:hypothetical protein